MSIDIKNIIGLKYPSNSFDELYISEEFFRFYDYFIEHNENDFSNIIGRKVFLEGLIKSEKTQIFLFPSGCENDNCIFKLTNISNRHKKKIEDEKDKEFQICAEIIGVGLVSKLFLHFL